LSNRNQHYLPKHYLRHFCIADSQLIGIAKVDPYKAIEPGPIRGQCQKAGFYNDSPGVDALLGHAEDDIAPVLIDVLRRNDFTMPQMVAQRLLAALLHARTSKSIEIAKVLPKYIASEFIKHQIKIGKLPPLPGGWNEDMMDFEDVAGMLIKATVIPCWLEAHTLALKLLRVTGNDRLITSDNPVVALNAFCSAVEPRRSFAGYSRAGFQLVLPISPLICLLFTIRRFTRSDLDGTG
jgi:hypothetical protein